MVAIGGGPSDYTEGLPAIDPCPFCGGKARLSTYSKVTNIPGAGGSLRFIWVGCDGDEMGMFGKHICHVSVFIEHFGYTEEHKEEAINKWNTREVNNANNTGL